MPDIKQITEIDLELTKTMSRVEEKVDNLVKTVGRLDDHQTEINGTVAKHQIMLTDYTTFKQHLEKSASDKAQIAAGIRSTIISIVIPIVVLLLIYLIEKIFHIQLPSG
jgi:predicted  nucleic acid-binding Zn-ribbon protein